jgi:hypothetical protein
MVPGACHPEAETGVQVSGALTAQGPWTVSEPWSLQAAKWRHRVGGDGEMSYPPAHLAQTVTQ